MRRRREFYLPLFPSMDLLVISRVGWSWGGLGCDMDLRGLGGNEAGERPEG